MSIAAEAHIGGRANVSDKRAGAGIKPKRLNGPKGDNGSNGPGGLTGYLTSSDAIDEAFERFFLDHYPRVVGVLTRIVGDRSRAEELAIEAFWRLYKQFPAAKARGGSSGNPGGWLYRTATHLGIDCLRAEARREHYEQKAASSPRGSRKQSPLDNVLAAESRGQVREALALLRPEQAQLLILRASGFSYQELASVLNVKRGSVGTMLVRAEDRFRRRYSQLFGKKEEI